MYSIMALTAGQSRRACACAGDGRGQPPVLRTLRRAGGVRGGHRSPRRANGALEPPRLKKGAHQGTPSPKTTARARQCTARARQGVPTARRRRAVGARGLVSAPRGRAKAEVHDAGHTRAKGLQYHRSAADCPELPRNCRQSSF